MRRFLPGPLTLAEPRDVALFFGLGALLACAVGATLATAALGFEPGPAARGAAWRLVDTRGPATCWAWLIGAPIALTLIGLPACGLGAAPAQVGLTLALVSAADGVGHAPGGPLGR